MFTSILFITVLFMSPIADIHAKNTQRYPLGTSKQLIAVYTKDWEATHGKLQRFIKHSNGKWRPVGDPIEVCVGKNGLGWGLGLHPDITEQPQKYEGDLKGPAGIFAISTIFSKSVKAKNIYKDMPVHIIKPCTEAIDDPRSRYYNKIIDTDSSEIGSKDWQSSEKMNEITLYDLGIVVDHNWPVRCREAGSCIFMHKWRNPQSPTAGCTGMKVADLETICRWLDSAQAPLLIQMPLPVYKHFQQAWQLPAIVAEPQNLIE